MQIIKMMWRFGGMSNTHFSFRHLSTTMSRSSMAILLLTRKSLMPLGVACLVFVIFNLFSTHCSFSFRSSYLLRYSVSLTLPLGSLMAVRCYSWSWNLSFASVDIHHMLVRVTTFTHSTVSFLVPSLFFLNHFVCSRWFYFYCCRFLDSLLLLLFKIFCVFLEFFFLFRFHCC